MTGSRFSIANIPFGIASSPSHPEKSVATRLYDTVIFLDELAKHKLLNELPQAARDSFCHSTLNAFAALSRSIHQQTRTRLQDLFAHSLDVIPLGCTAQFSKVTLHLPVSIGDFTDFSCSKDHVLNAGEAIMKKRFLPPGFLHFPVGYTGRSSSIVTSGTPIRRPWGQFRDDDQTVVYAPTRQLDYELEVACVIGKPSERGERIAIEDADEHIFGLVLLNDWSARDIQALEMPPLGPLNGKSFSTSISPWIITLDALQSFQTPAPQREQALAPYLQSSASTASYDIHLQADIVVNGQTTTVCKSELKSMYWTFRDLVAHQTSNGCNLNTGDLLATGTISGDTDESHGCLLELTEGGAKEFRLADGARRLYLEDGDSVRITGWAGEGVGFGDCVGEIQPALGS